MSECVDQAHTPPTRTTNVQAGIPAPQLRAKLRNGSDKYEVNRYHRSIDTDEIEQKHQQPVPKTLNKYHIQLIETFI
jgi:hypothetical protein